jgi:HSP20 family protein
LNIERRKAMNMVRRNSEIKPFYSNFLDDFLNTGLSAFEDRRGVPALMKRNSPWN